MIAAPMVAVPVAPLASSSALLAEGSRTTSPPTEVARRWGDIGPAEVFGRPMLAPEDRVDPGSNHR